MTHPRVLALSLPALIAGCAYGPPHAVQPDVACRATLRGEVLTTTIALPSGFRLEGQWFVLDLGPPRDGGGPPGRMVADLLLDNLVQADSVNDQPVSLPLYTSLRLRAAGSSAAEALQHVAETWCNTMLEANRRGVRFDRVVRAKPGQVA